MEQVFVPDLRLVAAYMISGLISLTATVAGIIFVRRRYHVEWKYLGYGALVFLVFQVVTRIPAVVLLQTLLADTLSSSPTILILWIGGLAVTAGLFEEVGRYLGYRYLFKNGRTWRNALMYGVGHGGLEALLLGTGAMLLALINYAVVSSAALLPGLFPPDQAEQIAQARALFASIPWWLPLLGGFERVAALVIQVSMAVVVLQSFLRHSKLWLYAAIAYHAVVDFVAVMVLRQFGPVQAEFAVGAFALISLYLIWALKPRTSERELDVVSRTS